MWRHKEWRHSPEGGGDVVGIQEGCGLEQIYIKLNPSASRTSRLD